MNIEIDLDDVIKQATELMAQRIVTDYLCAYDIGDYDKRELVQAQRTKQVFDKIDWSKAPDGLSQAAAKSFFERIINKLG